MATKKKRKSARRKAGRKSGMMNVELRVPRDLLAIMRRAVEGSPFTLEQLVNALLILGVIRDLLAKRDAPQPVPPQKSAPLPP